MKGKVSVYFAMPNVARFRSRVENPAKTLSSDLRTALADVISDVINSNQIQIRAKFIEKVDAMGLKYKSKAHEDKVKSVVEAFFDTYAKPTQAALNELVGDAEESEDGEGDGEPAGEAAPEAEAEKSAGKGKKEAKKESKKEDDFD